MTITDWMGALGQTAVVVVIAFVLLCAVTSWVRFQLMSESAREAEELGVGEDKAFRMAVLNGIAAARRARAPISVALLRLPAQSAPMDAVEALLGRTLRATDVVQSCGDGVVGLLLQCGSERVPVVVDRLVREAVGAGLTGAAAWRFGVAGYPEHGFKTSVLYPRAQAMLAEAAERGVKVAGMADPEAVAEAKTADPGLLDPVTGVVNEERMIGVMRRYIAQERRAERAVSMIYLEIDQMDRLTAVHTEPTMQAMLKELAGMIARSTRESDMLARFGAGGFVLAMATTPVAAMAIAQRLVTEVRKHAFAAGSGMKVTISAGLAGYPDVVGSAVHYFVAAEAALKQARVRGRSQCVAYDPSMVTRSMQDAETPHL
ncbi:MAG TPA: GGDEF domain-containing protein [Kiritimatiellia bacterium]|nr:GGDEF domain-containing protein [Kiritimatiellia bacterium]HMP35701.1 GGDEF domain-containing protein [Kiritimatiellia bacterium]